MIFKRALKYIKKMIHNHVVSLVRIRMLSKSCYQVFKSRIFASLNKRSICILLFAIYLFHSKVSNEYTHGGDSINYC